MIDPKIFDDISKRLSEALPSQLKDLEADLQQKFRSILQNTFAQLDLVSREEFDTQKKVLTRTRAKLDAMEKQITNLEDQSRD